MNVSYRPMQLKDVPKCVEYIAAHPVLGPRYGKLIERLPSAICFALRNEMMTSAVFEEIQGSVTRFVGVGMGVFISDDFLKELKTGPSFWVGPELVRRITSGKSPLLSGPEIREANSGAGLNLLASHLTWHPADIVREGVGTTLMTSFDQLFRGLRLREVIGQADCLEHMYAMRDSGGLYFDRLRGTYGTFPEVNVRNFSDEPRNIGITRELALHGYSWLSSLLVSYAPPRLGLSRAEQRLLVAARDGATDEELGERLGISLYAVKMRWRTIYDRAAAFLADLVTDNSRVDGEARRRGKEKKQHLLDYIRKHPEELHPVSRKLLHQSTRQETAPSSKSASCGLLS